MPTSSPSAASGTRSRSSAAFPQTGVTPGDPKAPVELIEFADLQCPYCVAVNTALLPQILERYARRGRVKLVLRSLAFLGNDSATAARKSQGID